MYLWCSVGHEIDTRELIEPATQAGVVFVPGDVFYPARYDGSGRHKLRLCFSAVPPAQIEEGIRRLAPAIDAARTFSDPAFRHLHSSDFRWVQREPWEDNRRVCRCTH